MGFMKIRQLGRFILIRKELSVFVAEIQTMIDNDPSKPMRSIVRDMGVSELLIK